MSTGFEYTTDIRALCSGVNKMVVNSTGINSTTIGATTPASGTFTTLSGTQISTTGNVYGKTVNPAYATTLTVGGTTALTAASAGYQYFTGSGDQTVTLPDPTQANIQTGATYTIFNISFPGTITVNSNGGNLIQNLLPGTKLEAILILITGQTAASWKWTYSANTAIGGYNPGLTSTPSTNQTITLTNESAGKQILTSVNNANYTLPVALTLQLGQAFYFENVANGYANITSSGGSVLQVMAPNTYLIATCINLSGTGTASWSWIYAYKNGGVQGYTTNTLGNGTTSLDIRATQQQWFTGTGGNNQTLVMPVVNTSMNLGQFYDVVNNTAGTGGVTVKSSDGTSTIAVVTAGTRLRLTVIALTGTGPSSWGIV